MDTLGVFYFRWKDDYLIWKEMPNAPFYENFTAQMQATLLWTPQA